VGILAVDSQSISLGASGRLQSSGAEQRTSRAIGTVKWFDVNRGYGFIVPNECNGESGDILIHYSLLEAFDRRDLPENAVVDCDYVSASKGLQAVRIHSIDTENTVAPTKQTVDIQNLQLVGEDDPLLFVQGHVAAKGQVRPSVSPG